MRARTGLGIQLQAGLVIENHKLALLCPLAIAAGTAKYPLAFILNSRLSRWLSVRTPLFHPSVGHLPPIQTVLLRQSARPILEIMGPDFLF